MDRIDFLEHVSGINYPGMLIDFFDHFIALKQLVEDNGSVTVIESNAGSIVFAIEFNSSANMHLAANTISQYGGTVIIYNRPIHIITEFPTDTIIRITLH